MCRPAERSLHQRTEKEARIRGHDLAKEGGKSRPRKPSSEGRPHCEREKAAREAITLVNGKKKRKEGW